MQNTAFIATKAQTIGTRDNKLSIGTDTGETTFTNDARDVDVPGNDSYCI